MSTNSPSTLTFTLGFSPCPNDTFIFDAMVNGKIDTRGLRFNYVMEDVETLNRWADEGKLDITKLSYNSFLHNVHQYALLHSGSALGKGVGPLLIQKGGNGTQDLSKAHIAIPGLSTTANLLLTLAHPEAKDKTEVLFSEIEDAVLRGEYDAGLVIHESRFTYAQRGLEKIVDLGDWWEQHSGAAIPLGGIVIRRDIDRELAATVDAVIRESVAYSWKHYPDLAPFVTANAQEMDESVMRQHIELYVNEYTTDLGPVGERAIHTLFQKAHAAGLTEEKELREIFY
jgi:1,4-dihydroxy-6-naphthoate synthase